MKNKWIVTREKDKDFNRVKVYSVRNITWNEWEGIDIWVNDNRMNCTDCSGPLQAMKSSCPHISAVKRFIIKENKT